MTQNIAERITAALTGMVNLYYEVAETDVAPYAVYTLSVSESLCKDGPYKYIGNVDLAIVGSSYAEADTLSTLALAAMSSLRSADLFIKMEDHTENPENNEWIMETKYTITQLI